MTIDPKIKFIITLVVFLAVGISQGTVNLAHAIPADWIQSTEAWAGIIAFIGTGVTTVLSGMGMTVSSRLSSAASVDGFKGMVVEQKIADTAKAAAGDNATVTVKPEPPK